MPSPVYVFVPTILTTALLTWIVTKWWSRSHPSSSSSSSSCSKLQGVTQWVVVSHDPLLSLTISILRCLGCDESTAAVVGKHLVDSNLQSVDSHGVVRLAQYCEQAEKKLFDPRGTPSVRQTERGGWVVDGNSGFGITALQAAVRKGLELLQDPTGSGVAAVGVVNCGHTGRLSEFVEMGANAGALTIICGGGSRRCWRQVAPYGGAKGVLPTNPWAVGMPGDGAGPVILDFATSAMAGGWVMAALHAGASLPGGAIIDKDGNPSTDPQDYKDGGALLPAAGPKGYGLGLMAELIGGALLGEVETEAGLGLNSLVILLDTNRFMAPEKLQAGVHSVLEDVRGCPPASGHKAVLVPGQWEREHAERVIREGVRIPKLIWERLSALANRLGINTLPQVREI